MACAHRHTCVSSSYKDKQNKRVFLCPHANHSMLLQFAGRGDYPLYRKLLFWFFAKGWFVLPQRSTKRLSFQKGIFVVKQSTQTWEEEGWLRDQESLCLDLSVPWLGPFLGCLLLYKGRFLCLPFSALEAHGGPHLGTEGIEVRCAWVKISFVTLGCSLSLRKFPFFYGVVMTVMALEGGCGVCEEGMCGHLVYLVLDTQHVVGKN